MADRSEVVRLYQSGMTLNQIKEQLGVNIDFVRYAVIKAGIHVVKKQPSRIVYTSEQIQRLRDAYPNLGASALAKEFGCTAHSVRNKAYQLGIKCPTSNYRKGQVAAAQNTTVNINFFDSWTPESAYVLGYIWADGSIRHINGQSVALSFLCTESDAQLIRDIARAMGNPGNLRHHPAREWTVKSGPYAGRIRHSKPGVKLQINSTLLAQTLVETHGIPPRKSYVDAPFPANVPDDLFHHFARGHLDGDGCITVSRTKNKATVYWIATPQFMTGLKDRIIRLAGVQYSPVSSAGRLIQRVSWTAKPDVLRLREWLYQDATLLLKRKRDKFDLAATKLEQVKDYARRKV